jgi:hypothetical protein
MSKDYEYVDGIGYVAYIDGKRVVYDRDELPELLERIRQYKFSKGIPTTPEPEKKSEEVPSLKEYLRQNIHKYPELKYVLDKEENNS